MENVQSFLKAIKKYGVADEEIFQTPDLFEARNISQVYINVIKKKFFRLDSLHSFLWYWAMCVQNLSQFQYVKYVLRSFWNFVHF